MTMKLTILHLKRNDLMTGSQGEPNLLPLSRIAQMELHRQDFHYNPGPTQVIFLSNPIPG